MSASLKLKRKNLIAGVALACGFFFHGFAKADQIVNVPADDKMMNAAIAKALETLPKFWAHLAKPRPGEENFALKLKISDGAKVEHFWCGHIEGDAVSATCVIDNDPEIVKTVKAGERIKVDPALISDWMLTRGDKILGGQTIRVLLPHLDEAQADALRAALSDDQLEAQ
ncbi:MAG: DUF2314 domain-containing protein [Alphaproteobacteria bacterium]|nr:DUF2314 domain-containing protein [Alphaproteobacteria bacterium]